MSLRRRLTFKKLTLDKQQGGFRGGTNEPEFVQLRGVRFGEIASNLKVFFAISENDLVLLQFLLSFAVGANFPSVPYKMLPGPIYFLWARLIVPAS